MVDVLTRPNFPPYVCLLCGAGSGRKWFADLGLPIENYFNPVNNGACYVCDECWDGLSVTIAQKVQVLLVGTEPWQGRVEPTYDDTTDIEETNGSGPGIPDPSATGTDPVDAADDQDADRSDDEPESDDSDPESESVREFRGFFGGNPGGNP